MLYKTNDHEYYWGNKLIPSVTQIVNPRVWTGYSDAMERGKQAHLDMELAVIGLKQATIWDYVKALLQITNVYATELAITDGEIAGTVDLLAENERGEVIVIDWKTGNKYAWHNAQLGGYVKILLNECNGNKYAVTHIVDVYLDSNDVVELNLYKAIACFDEKYAKYKYEKEAQNG